MSVLLVIVTFAIVFAVGYSRGTMPKKENSNASY